MVSFLFLMEECKRINELKTEIKNIIKKDIYIQY